MSQSASPELRVESYRTLDALQSIVPAWEALLAHYPLTSTFSTWEWFAPWWHAFGKDRDLLALGFWQGEDLVGFAALSYARERRARGIRLKVLRLMGDGSGDSDNLDIPVRPGCEALVTSAFLRYLAKNKGEWDVLELNTLPSGSLLATALAVAAEQQNWKMVQSQRVASVVSLPATWEEYLQQLSSEDQKNLTRYSRRLEKRYETKVYRVTQESELDRCLEALFRLHQQRWEADGQPGSFGSEQRRLFYHDLSRALLRRGWLELWALELNAEYAAVQYAFRYRDVVYQLQEGNDPRRSSDRVGFILRGEVMKQLIAEGVRAYDFLGGQPGYKARWGAKVTHYQDIHLARPNSFGSIYLSTLQTAVQGKEWLRKQLPESAWTLLHRLNVGMRNGDVRKKPDTRVNHDAAESPGPKHDALIGPSETRQKPQ
jgi:CelD/BcsL family acetyltransferase involved in cellulose biosynthesis